MKADAAGLGALAAAVLLAAVGALAGWPAELVARLVVAALAAGAWRRAGGGAGGAGGAAAVVALGELPAAMSALGLLLAVPFLAHSGSRSG